MSILVPAPSILGTGFANAATYRYLRLYVSDANSFLSLTKLRWLNSSVEQTPLNMTSNSAPSPNVTSASTELSASFEAWGAFDSSTSTYWLTANSTDPHWIKIDLGSGNEVSVDEIGITVSAHSAAYYPVDFQAEGSNNDSTWDVLGSWTGETSWTVNVERLFSF